MILKPIDIFLRSLDDVRSDISNRLSFIHRFVRNNSTLKVLHMATSLEVFGGTLDYLCCFVTVLALILLSPDLFKDETCANSQYGLFQFIGSDKSSTWYFYPQKHTDFQYAGKFCLCQYFWIFVCNIC